MYCYLSECAECICASWIEMDSIRESIGDISHCRDVVKEYYPLPQYCSMHFANPTRIMNFVFAWQSAHITLQLCLLNLQGDMGTLPCNQIHTQLVCLYPLSLLV